MMLSLLKLTSLALSLALVNAKPISKPIGKRCAATKANSTSPSTSPIVPVAPKTSGFVSSTWYAGWHSSDFPPSSVSWSKYTQVTYSFAVTTPDVNTLSFDGSDPDSIPEFVSLAHQNNVKAGVAIGGWTGGLYFSSNVATAANRTAFVKTVTTLATTNGFDAVNFDWEYPGKAGIGCAVISPQDSANFLTFLQLLRADPVGKTLTVSAAVSLTPFAGSDGTPMSDVSAFAQVLDWIEIMNYDVWGSWSSGVGPNAPLADACAPAADQQGSATSAVAAWTAAGFPADQIVIGVASYGHSFHVANSAALSGNTLNAYPAFDNALQPTGDSWDGAAGVDECGNQVPVGGIFDFWGMIDGGFLTSNGTAASGIDYRYDSCSQTPYVYNPTSQVMISYDDATSFAAKGSFIQNKGLKGFAMWQAGGDSNDILLDAIRSAAGVSS